MVVIEEIKAIITNNKLVKPEDVESLAKDMYAWYQENHRDMKMREFNKLLKKYPGHRTFKE